MSNIEINPLIELGFRSAEFLNNGDQKAFSEIIKSTRKSLGMTQMEISNALGISQSAYSKIESGSLTFDALQWFRFCQLIMQRFNLIWIGEVAAPKIRKSAA